MPDIREKILAFINSPKDVPVLAGFSLGFYMLLFYYSKNFSLANSLHQFLFFFSYYILLPVVVLYAGYKIIGFTRFAKYKTSFLFFAMACLFAFYLLQLLQLGPVKRVYFAIVIVVAALGAYKGPKYYKLGILLLFLMSVFNVKPLVSVAWVAVSSSSEWKQQPDDIENIVFKDRPNIYYIQPDGYASFKNLGEDPYNFDNTSFNGFLRNEGFTVYDDFRSNYISTLLSNSSMFSMKHHHSAKYIDMYAARNIIVGENPVLTILEKNNYKTHFITEKPYLVINRPAMGYDYSNVDYSDLPFIRDGWGYAEPISEDFKKLQIGNTKGNFYFLEKMSPNHIEGFKANSEGIKKEREKYLERLKETNVWLKEIITHINKQDPGALIIIGADHGGYVGYEYTIQAFKKTDNPVFARSIFGAALAIKWNRPDFKQYDGKLISSVNLFRTVFSYLSKDKKYLDHLQENSSYIRLTEPKGLYRYINDKGQAVFKKADELQD
jgi:hypothetical protein